MSRTRTTDTPPRTRSWRPRLILLGVGVVVAVVGFFVWRSQHTQNQRDEGLRLAKAGKFADAEPLLLTAFTRDGTDTEVVSALAQVRLTGPDPATAEEFLSRWCELQPKEARPLSLRMDLRSRIARGKWSVADRNRIMDEAIADGQRVLELEPLNDPARREVIRMLLQVGRPAEAEAECRKSLVAAPNDGWLYYLLAKALHGQSKRAEAEATLDRVKDAPPVATPLLLRATLYREADQPDKAIPLLRKALTLPNPPRVECLYQLGLALASVGQADAARRAMAEVDLLTLEKQIADSSFPNNPAMRVQVAEAKLGMDRFDDARKDLGAVLAENPDFPPAHRVMALLHERTGQPDKAAEHRRRAAGKDAR